MTTIDVTQQQQSIAPSDATVVCGKRRRLPDSLTSLSIDDMLKKRTLETRGFELASVARLVDRKGVVPDNSVTNKILGVGTYAKVFSIKLEGGAYIACKNVAEKDDIEEDAATKRELIMEPRIAEFISRRLLLPAMMTCFEEDACCPNFVALIKHSFSDKFLRKTKQGIVEGFSDKSVKSMYFELCQNGTLEDFMKTNSTPYSDSEARKLAASMIGQMAVAVLAMASMSLSHNDLRPSNWLFTNTNTPNDGLYYCLPTEDGDLFITLPGGANIPFLALTDFGIASVDQWDKDPRLDYANTTNGGYGGCPICSIYYYRDPTDPNSVGVDHTPFKRLSLTSSGDSLGQHRPMRFSQIGEFERDFATIFSYFEEFKGTSETPPERNWTELLKKLSTLAIDKLSEKRPKEYADLRCFVVELMRDSDLFFGCVSSVRPKTNSRVWRLPSEEQGTEFREDLMCMLEEPVRMGDQFNLFD
jgi:serine/threonine protein kinase